jgi:hypothetical protein
VIICIHPVYYVLYCVCSSVCCVSFDRGFILCDVCYLFVVSYCKPLPPRKNPFAVNKYYIFIITKGKGKVVPVLNYHEGLWGSGCMDPHILDLCSSLSRVVRFMPWPLYPRYSLDRRRRGCVVSIATSCELDERGVGVRVPVGSRIFSMSSRPVLGSTQPPIQWVPAALSPRVKRQGRETEHSPPASADVKKMWIYMSTPPYVFMA